MTWPFENDTSAITKKIAISAFYSLQKTPLVERLRIVD